MFVVLGVIQMKIKRNFHRLNFSLAQFIYGSFFWGKKIREKSV